MSDFTRRYMAFERGLIQRFRRHPVLRYLSSASRHEFTAFLLQLGFLSSEFVKWYERAKQGFTSEEAKELIRSILRDEIPTGAPTHQDDRLEDLRRMGVPVQVALNTRGSAATRRTTRKMYELVRYPQDNYDLRALVTLRIAGEVLVGETYRYVCPQLHRHGLSRAESKFYWPHFVHDELHEEGAEGHSNSFDSLLDQLITSEEELQIAEDAAEAAFRLRYDFLSQFTREYQIFRFTKQLVAAAAAVAFISLGVLLPVRFCFDTEQHPPQSLEIADGSASYEQFQRECDLWLVRRAKETGDVSYLATVGTPESPMTVWGQGL